MKRFIFAFLFVFTALFFTACSSGEDDDWGGESGGGYGGSSPLRITVQPQDGEFPIGAPIKPFSVTAVGGSGEITYQWYSNTIDSVGGATAITGATGKTYTPDATNYGSYYYYVVVKRGDETVTSRVAAIDITELIASVQDLKDIDASTSDGVVYKLTGNINLTNTYDTDAGWTPIGTSSSPFKGTFKGGNNTISGLYIKRDTSTDTYVGLFGYLGEGAKVSDVTLVLHNSGITGYAMVGGLAGYAKGTAAKPIEIKNVHVTDNNGGGIKPASSGRTTAAGGIVGELAGNATIRGSSNSVMVTVTTGWDANSGGIAGKASNTDNIYNSFNTGSVSAYSVTLGSSYAGGIVGYGGRDIERCYNSGVVEIASSRRVSYAGGIIAYTIPETSIHDSYNSGDVPVKTVANLAYAGGIAGYQNSDSTIERTYNTGIVSAESGNNHAHAGGITGAFTTTGTNYTLTNSVAANTSLTATSGGRYTYINRIAGYPDTLTSNSDLGNNLALSTMTATANGEIVNFDDTKTVNYGTDVNADDLKKKATYTGIGWLFGEDNDNSWDDNNPWKIDTKISPYPTLYWQK
jgi:hypothetical protein